LRRELDLLGILVQFVSQFGWRDFLDVAFVSVGLYYLLLALKGTRGVQIMQGVLFLLALLLIAHTARLPTTIWLLQGFLVSVAVALPVIFQPELRRALMRLGQQGILPSSALNKMGKEELGKLIDELAYAASALGQLRQGALIVLERETGLQEFIENGQAIDGRVSSKLLQSIFNPASPLHDGAVILRGSDIVAAQCYLPLSDAAVNPKFGTRHRAALGIAEQTDAVVLVVSEETGEARIAHDRELGRAMTEEADVRKALARHLLNIPETTKVNIRQLLGKQPNG
ncbi:TIGR00159 family protein, partial [bacterium CPR1]|nr:TIGR00159 family protein [bacterium CPR1]